jgi:hypothetical protein
MKKILILALFITPLSSIAQKAILYKFDFKVPKAYRKQIINYDRHGNIAYYTNEADMKVPDVHTQQLSNDQITTICESTGQMLKVKYGYQEVEILYPKNPWTSLDKLENFPNKGYKRTAKKMPADAYVEIAINFKDKMVGHPADPEELNQEIEMRFELLSELTVFDGSGNIIDEISENHSAKLQPLLSGKYQTELKDNGTFVVSRPYFTQEDIITIFGLVKEIFLSTSEKL